MPLPETFADVLRALTDQEIADLSRFLLADRRVGDLQLRAQIAESILFNARADYKAACDNAAVRWFDTHILARDVPPNATEPLPPPEAHS